MNKSRIEWTDFTWNPVTGCTAGCDYCYGRAFTKRFGQHKVWQPLGMAQASPSDGAWPYDFYPTFYEHRLNEPARCAKPSRVFAVSMGDLFGPQVPDWVIAKVFVAMKAAKQHQFLVLTKQPLIAYHALRRLKLTPHQFDLAGGVQFGTWPDDYRHVLIGASLSGDPGESWRIETIGDITRVSGARTFLSLEPLLHEPPLAQLTQALRRGVQWVIVGGLTGARRFRPPAEWIDGLAYLCRREGVPLFVKDNAGYPREVKEFPRW